MVKLFVLPDSMRKSTVIKHHDIMGHLSVERTTRRIQVHYWFPGMRRYIRNHINSCVECLFTKVPGGKQAGYLHPIPPPKRPFQRIHTDLEGPFVRTEKGNSFILVIIDSLTKYVKLYAIANSGSDEVIRGLQQFFLCHGLVETLVSDRGSCYTSTDFENFLNRNGVHHTLNSSRHPRANGQVERVNRTLVSMMAASIDSEQSWDDKLLEVERDLNTAVNETTGYTPFEALYGYLPRFYDGKLRQLIANDEEWRPPAKIQKEIEANIRHSQIDQKRRFDEKRYKGMKFNVGDVVVVKRNVESTGESTKLQPKYKGPMVVIEELPKDTYRITHLNERLRGRLNTTAHVSQMKIYKPHVDELEEEACENTESTSESDPEETEDENVQSDDPKPEEDFGRSDIEGRPERRRQLPKKLEDYLC